MRKKPYAFLGQYLVGNELITESQLHEAIHLQKENNVLIGNVALEEGIIDEEQLDYLIHRQLGVDERLGTLAVTEGFMTEEHLELVLSIQGKNHLFLGESLLRLGTISEECLGKAIKDFETQIISQENFVRERISHLPMAAELLITLGTTLRFFYRLGYAIRIIDIVENLPYGFQHLYFYCSEQHFKREGTRYVGLGMPHALVQSVVQESIRYDRFNASRADIMENMSQMIFNLNYLVCKEMKKSGIHVKHGIAFISMPSSDCSGGVCIEMETVTNSMIFAYRSKGKGV